jgi:uncharacterized protein YdcH (DUF465 family)
MAGLQGPNQLLDFLHALRRRRYQVLVPALLVSTIGIALAVIVPKRFRISTRIEITEGTRVEPDYRLKNPQESGPRREAPSASEHIVHYNRVKEVIERNLAQWPEYVQARTEAERARFIKERILDRNLWAGPSTRDNRAGTIFIDVTYYDEDPARAAKFLDDLTKSWLVDVVESDRTMLRTEKERLGTILDGQAAALHAKEDQLYNLIQSLGVDPSVKGGEGNWREDKGDWTFRTLDKARTDLTDVEEKLRTARFELEQDTARWEAEPETEVERVPLEAKDPASEIEKRRAGAERLRDELATLRPANSKYRRLKEQLDELEAEIAELERAEPPPSERLVEKENPRKEELRLAVQAQEDEVGQLEDRRDALRGKIEELERETDARTEQYQYLEDLQDQVAEARLQKNATLRQWQDRDKSLQMLETSPPPWRIAQPPVPSSASRSPNPYLLSAMAVFAGLALGVGLAVVSEYARSSYRTVADLASVMSVPVLGSIGTIVTRRERRALQLSRAVAALSTALIVGSIGWVTYLWHWAPERLPMEVQDAIERLRTVLK